MNKITINDCDKAINDLKLLVESWNSQPFSEMFDDVNFENRNIIRDCLKLDITLRDEIGERNVDC